MSAVPFDHGLDQRYPAFFHCQSGKNRLFYVLMKTELLKLFRELFGEREHVVISSAPGRTNLIGEHTDYNEGLCMPFAISRRTFVIAALSDEPYIRVYSQNLHELFEAYLYELVPGLYDGPKAYLMGPIFALREAGFRFGMDMAVYGEIPFGMGLGSSAALEVAVAAAAVELLHADIRAVELVTLARRAETLFVGVPCGLMDQTTVTMARSGQVMMLDCRTRDFIHLPFPKAMEVVIALSGVRHSLADGAYAGRVRQCKSAMSKALQTMPDIRAIRDICINDLPALAGKMSDPEFLRISYVVEEIERVRQAKKALLHGDSALLGRIMEEGQAGLREKYQVSVDEIDALIDAATQSPGYVGARLTGAGFGGATINLVKRGQTMEFIQALTTGYAKRTNRELQAFVVEPSQGVYCHELG